MGGNAGSRRVRAFGTPGEELGGEVGLLYSTGFADGGLDECPVQSCKANRKPAQPGVACVDPITSDPGGQQVIGAVF